MISFFARPYARSWAHIWSCMGAYICLCMLLSSPVAAQTSEPEGSLTLATALQTTLRHSPELAVTQYSLRAAEARIEQAGLRPNPQLSLELEDFAGTGELRGMHSLQTTLSLSQVIELGDKRRRRVATATAGLDLNGIEKQAQELDIFAEVNRRFLAVVEAQETLAFAQRSVELAESAFNAIDVRVQAARSPEAERSRASVALLRARLEVQHAQGDLDAARYALAAMWGSNAPAFTRAEAQLFELPTTVEFTTLTQRLQANPDFLRFAAESRLREAELRLAQAQARSNLNFTLGMRRLETSDDVGLVAGISMPLRLFDRNQGAIHEAETRRVQADAAQRAARVKAEATLYALYQELIYSRTLAATLRNEGLPQAQRALDQTRYGYDRGRFSYMELATAQRELLELESAAITAAAETHRLMIEIERLTDEPLAASE